jgi:DNA-3-methyladenine glycosylase I
MNPSKRIRCEWALSDALYMRYHDREWGVPLHDDGRLFEFLVLEGAQAGLSWLTVLRKRERYRAVFDGFDPVRVAAFDAQRVNQLMADSGIIRNRRKIASAIRNARAFLRIQEEFGSFDAYVWRFVDGAVQQNAWRRITDIPAQTPVSKAMSTDLKRRGCSFVGPTICYAFMQAVGMVNDHVVSCFRYHDLHK